ncbi:MAG: ATP-binding protein [Pseudanabaenales cyanobacterium]|nr:ATP-binding protein [Pseudanabaenales cyanobacterium]
MAHWYVLKAFKARIAQRITAWVFGSLLVIEAAILPPSYLKREHDLLANQESLVMTSLETALLNPQTTQSGALNQRVLEHLRSQFIILGGAIYQQDGTLLNRHGNSPQLDLQAIEALLNDPILNRVAQTYDTAIRITQADPPLYLVIRHDIRAIQQELNAYTGRMISMIILISVVVTLGTMIGVERLVIRPILYLHNDLLMAATNIRKGVRDSPFHATSLQRRDELGEVIVTFQHMYNQIWQALEERKAANLSEQQERERANQLCATLTQLHQTQAQLVQAEKMAGLGRLVAGIAHEINNPVNFIHGNLAHVQQYVQDLLELVQLYQHHYPTPVAEIQTNVEEIDLDFIRDDLPKILSSMKIGTDRIRDIVLSLRNFSRLDEAEIKPVDIHQGLDSTLMILNHCLKACPEKPEIQVIRDYVALPPVECYAGLLNQVFINILSNAIDALAEEIKQRTVQECIDNPSQITLRTSLINEQWVEIAIADNGPGMSQEIQRRIFEPFFTTKPIGQGTGMGMSISYQIVTERHRGKLECFSNPGKGTEFVIQIPLRPDSCEIAPSRLKQLKIGNLTTNGAEIRLVGNAHPKAVH